ncbi:hypothetical protein BBJ28_00014915 [Nothophytophthora sp. Chile5]|nr:hypothetical protein BBJ28_00014915 [Nothophytophthora sp. Chile5]
MRERTLFTSLQCIVHPDELEAAELLALELCLRDGGATLLDDAACSSSSATHIVCHPRAYHSLMAQRNERFVALVRPEWVFRTFLMQRLLPVDRFSANPALFFSSLAIAAGSIEKDPRKVIHGLIAHFGGQIVDQKQIYDGATHILSSDESSESANAVEEPEHQQLLQLSFAKGDVSRGVESWRVWLSDRPTGPPFTLPSCVVAYMGQCAGLAKQHHVTYSWIEECVRRHSRVPEGPFACNTSGSSSKAAKRKPISWKTRPELHLEDLNLSKCSQVYQLARMELGTDLSIVRKLPPEKLASMESSLSGAIVLLAQHIAPLLKEKISEVLKTVKAKVANVPQGDSYKEIVSKVVANASFVVCRYCGGFEYDEALRQGKRVVSIYWVLAGLTPDSKPTSFTEAIERPVRSFGGIVEMQYFVITLSGFTSRTSPSREEMQVAIHATGACMLPVLSRTHSTHLICNEASGEKYKRALSWRFENILSHEWIFACLSQWQHVAEDTFRFNAAKPKTLPIVKEDEDEPEQEVTDKTTLTPGSKRSKRAAKSGQGRFDVDGILTELDRVPTPTDKKSPANPKTATPAAAAKATAKATAAGEKEVACTLFDTPTMTSKRRTRKKDGDEPMPETSVAVEQPGATTTNAQPGDKDLPLVISISSGSEANASGTLEAASASPVAKAPAKGKTPSAKGAAAKKRKGVDTEESMAVASKASSGSVSKKRKKETAASESIEAAPPAKSEFLFLLTGSREQAAVHEPIISTLGASVSQIGRKFDSKCTHIICSELKRTEKFVAGCASGKWILKPSFLEASSAAGRFVDEAAHEWGALPGDKEFIDPRIWPEAPAYWRKERAAGQPGAFTGWRFFIHSKCLPPSDMCERIVIAGGGSVLPLAKATDFAEVAKQSTSEAPVVALFPAGVSTRDAWLKKLKAQKIECLNASFLIDCITKQQTPAVQRTDYCV